MSLSDSPKISPKILSGIIIRDERILELKKKFQLVRKTPKIAIIQVGDRPDSTAYIQVKINFAKKVGVIAQHIHLPDSISESEIIEKIKECNLDSSISGIIVQLPLPMNINRDKVIDSIDSSKDLDGLTSLNKELLSENNVNVVTPATARGVLELLKYYKIELKDKKITIIGRSALVGKPIAQLCTNVGALVTVAHSQTPDLIKETKGADIIIVAVGKKNLIGAEHVKKGQVIIDIGINRDDRPETGVKKIVGDVDFDAVSKVIGNTGAITPVPGGVGPMTVMCLFENLADILSRDMIK